MGTLLLPFKLVYLMAKNTAVTQTMLRCSLSIMLPAAFLLVFPGFVLWQAFKPFDLSIQASPPSNEGTESWCPIPEPEDLQHCDDGLRPSSDFSKPGSIEIQVERLASAVRVATESWDDNGDVDVDPRWKSFDEFHRVLRELFPKV